MLYNLIKIIIYVSQTAEQKATKIWVFGLTTKRLSDSIGEREIRSVHLLKIQDLF
jgi:hypothetical protein